LEAGRIAHVPFPLMAVLVAGLALVVEVVGFELRLGLWSIALLAIPLALIVVYLAEYRKLPYVAPLPAAAVPIAPAVVESAPADEADFVDPVEEADRLESGGSGPAADAEGSPAPGEPADATPPP
jgi:hypothetical protein